MLTQEYLRGRRASYTPPFRMYLILSVAFFLIATLGGNPGATCTSTSTTRAVRTCRSRATSPHRRPTGRGGAKALRRASRRGGRAPSRDGRARAGRAEAGRRNDPARRDDREAHARAKDRAQASAGTRRRSSRPCLPHELGKVKEVLSDPCSTGNFKVDLGPFGKEYEPRLRQACQQDLDRHAGLRPGAVPEHPEDDVHLPAADRGGDVRAVHRLGRYYVEHLLFFVHFHAFFFLGGLVILLVERASLAGAGHTPLARRRRGRRQTSSRLAFVIYVPVYLYRRHAARLRPGPHRDLLKYSMLGIAYLFCMTITAVGLLVLHGAHALSGGGAPRA